MKNKYYFYKKLYKDYIIVFDYPNKYKSMGIDANLIKYIGNKDVNYVVIYNDYNVKIVKRKTIEVKPMNEEEAILQMELLGHQFYMYKDSETGKCAVLYKRKDGNYGIIDTK